MKANMPDFEASLNELLIDIYNSVSKYEEKALKSLPDTAVTASEAHIIEAVAKAGGGSGGDGGNGAATVSDIAAALDVAVPTVTVALKKLEGRGLITKSQSSEDGRKSLVRLTELGVRINRAHAYFHRQMVRSVGRDMTEEEKRVLLSATAKLSAFLKETVGTDAVRR